MELIAVEQRGEVVVEGQPGASFMTSAHDVDRIIEACFSEGAKAALLYAANMSPAFFDLSSGEAGIVLQKLRNYRIRLALVAPPGSIQFSSRFGEMVADEQRGTHFGIFDTRQAALDWLG
jgi:hypothetical protein